MEKCYCGYCEKCLGIERKHTPAPWRVENNGDGDLWISDENDATIVESFGGNANLDDVANAQFIVKAVNSHGQLIEALNQIREHASGECECTNIEDCSKIICLLSQQAIKKTEG